METVLGGGRSNGLSITVEQRTFLDAFARGFNYNPFSAINEILNGGGGEVSLAAFNELSSTVDDIQTMITTIEEALTSLEERITEEEATSVDLDIRIEQNRVRLDNNDTVITGINTQLSNESVDLDTAFAELASHGNSITSLNTDMSNVLSATTSHASSINAINTLNVEQDNRLNVIEAQLLTIPTSEQLTNIRKAMTIFAEYFDNPFTVVTTFTANTSSFSINSADPNGASVVDVLLDYQVITDTTSDLSNLLVLTNAIQATHTGPSGNAREIVCGLKNYAIALSENASMMAAFGVTAEKFLDSFRWSMSGEYTLTLGSSSQANFYVYPACIPTQTESSTAGLTRSILDANKYGNFQHYMYKDTLEVTTLSIPFAFVAQPYQTNINLAPVIKPGSASTTVTLTNFSGFKLKFDCSLDWAVLFS